MSDIYKRDKAYALPGHNAALTALQEVFGTLHISYFIIGAQARNILLFEKGIRQTRVTRDIDFAIMVQDHNQYDDVMEALVSQGFEATAEPYRLRI